MCKNISKNVTKFEKILVKMCVLIFQHFSRSHYKHCKSSSPSQTSTTCCTFVLLSWYQLLYRFLKFSKLGCITLYNIKFSKLGTFSNRVSLLCSFTSADAYFLHLWCDFTVFFSLKKNASKMNTKKREFNEKWKWSQSEVAKCTTNCELKQNKAQPKHTNNTIKEQLNHI